MIGGNIRKTITISLILIFMFSMVQIVPFEESWVNNVSAESTWTQTSMGDFLKGTSKDLDFFSSGQVKLDLRTRYVEDNFLDESNIWYKNQVIFDTNAGNVRLMKFMKQYGGSDTDFGFSVQETSDGGYIISGDTASYGVGDRDLWLIKTDALGNEIWNRTWGGTNWDCGNSVLQTTDGGFVVAGWVDFASSGNDDVCLIKTDAAGNELWKKTYGGSSTDRGHSVQQTSDGGFVICGHTYSYDSGYNDVWLIKTDSSGNELWNKSYGGSEHENGRSVAQTNDGGYIIAGHTETFSSGGYDLWLIKTNSTGDSEWDKVYGSSSYDDYGSSVQQTTDSGYIITGSTIFQSANSRDIWLIKTNGTGDLEWDQKFDVKIDDRGYSVRQTGDGGYIVLGCIEGGTEEDMYLLKTNDTGVRDWSSSPGPVDKLDTGQSVQPTSDGGYVCAGSIWSSSSKKWDAWLVKTNSLGLVEFTDGGFNSTNLLLEGNASSIDSFTYKASIPDLTHILLQFSKDNDSWCNSFGMYNEWNDLLSGERTIDISSLDWIGSEFYYRTVFLSNYAQKIPILTKINLTYKQYVSTGILESQAFDSSINAYWKTLNWHVTNSTAARVKFQLKTGLTKSALNTKEYVGPNGTPGSFYETAPANIWAGHNGDRWLKFKVDFYTNDKSQTPILDEVAIDYNTLPTVILTTPTGELSGDVQINYTLFDLDTVPDKCEIIVEFSTDNSTFYSAAQGTGGDPISELTTSYMGAPHTYIWDSDTDLAGEDSNVYIRITPLDDDIGYSNKTLPFHLDNNDVPIVTNIEVTGESGDIKIKFKLIDNENDLCDINVEYQGGSAGSTWTRAFIKESAFDIKPGLDKKLTWNSGKDEKDQESDDYKIRITPRDNDYGISDTSMTFSIDNNDPPSISDISIAGNSGNIKLQFDLIDPEEDRCDLIFEYKGGSVSNTWTPASILETTTDIKSGIDKVFTWQSKMDEMDQDSTDYEIKITPCDIDIGTDKVSNPFHIDNQPPCIISVLPKNNSKEVNITEIITLLFDEEMDLSTLKAAFSIDPEVNGKFFKTYDDITFEPQSGFSYNTQYKVTISNYATDLYGNKLKEPKTWVFNTKFINIDEIDSDDDGMPDHWEERYGFDTKINDSYYDPDNDELSNLEEFKYKTHPLEPDSDNDGLFDGEEVNIYKTDPNHEDTDRDGHKDSEDEYPTDSSRWKKDTFFEDILWIIILIIIVIIVVILFFIMKKRRKKEEPDEYFQNNYGDQVNDVSQLQVIPGPTQSIEPPQNIPTYDHDQPNYNDRDFQVQVQNEQERSVTPTTTVEVPAPIPVIQPSQTEQTPRVPKIVGHKNETDHN